MSNNGLPSGAQPMPGDSAMASNPGLAATALLGERALSKLKWRCRRGLLENDLFIEKFFLRHESTLTVRQAKGLDDLMDLSDNDLLDLLIQRKEPSQVSAASAATDEALEVLNMMRTPSLAR